MTGFIERVGRDVNCIVHGERPEVDMRIPSHQVEAVARAICRSLGHDPNAKEPGDFPKCDGRGYPGDRPDEYKEPWHWFWRHYTDHARAAIRAMKEQP